MSRDLSGAGNGCCTICHASIRTGVRSSVSLTPSRPRAPVFIIYPWRDNLPIKSSQICFIIIPWVFLEIEDLQIPRFRRGLSPRIYLNLCFCWRCMHCSLEPSFRRVGHIRCFYVEFGRAMSGCCYPLVMSIVFIIRVIGDIVTTNLRVSIIGVRYACRYFISITIDPIIERRVSPKIVILSIATRHHMSYMVARSADCNTSIVLKKSKGRSGCSSTGRNGSPSTRVCVIVSVCTTWFDNTCFSWAEIVVNRKSTLYPQRKSTVITGFGWTCGCTY